MNNGKKGVTIIVLSMIMIVMVVLAGLVSLNISDMIDTTYVKEFASELQQLEYLVDDYKIRNNGNIDFTEYTIDTADISAQFLEQLSEENIVDGTVTLYKLDFVKIDVMDTNYGQEIEGADDIYLVSKETGNVYYKLGFGYQGQTYYTLTETLEDMLEK